MRGCLIVVFWGSFTSSYCWPNKTTENRAIEWADRDFHAKFGLCMPKNPLKANLPVNIWSFVVLLGSCPFIVKEGAIPNMRLMRLLSNHLISICKTTGKYGDTKVTHRDTPVLMGKGKRVLGSVRETQNWECNQRPHPSMILWFCQLYPRSIGWHHSFTMSQTPALRMSFVFWDNSFCKNVPSIKPKYLPLDFSL